MHTHTHTLSHRSVTFLQSGIPKRKEFLFCLNFPSGTQAHRHTNKTHTHTHTRTHKHTHTHTPTYTHTHTHTHTHTNTQMSYSPPYLCGLLAFVWVSSGH